MRRQKNEMSRNFFRQQSIHHLSLCLILILQRRLKQTKKNPRDTPKIMDELNSIVLFRHDVEEYASLTISNKS